MPDATGLELLAQALGDATVQIDPARIREVLAKLRERGYSFLASVHGVDYYPEEPRLGVHYELLDMKEVDRISVKARVHTDAPRIASVVDLWPGANHPEREGSD